MPAHWHQHFNSSLINSGLLYTAVAPVAYPVSPLSSLFHTAASADWLPATALLDGPCISSSLRAKLPDLAESEACRCTADVLCPLALARAPLCACVLQGLAGCADCPAAASACRILVLGSNKRPVPPRSWDVRGSARAFEHDLCRTMHTGTVRGLKH